MVVDMRTWSTVEVDVVDDIFLDPLNVRLETPAGAPEADIIHDLFTNEKALSLVEAIARVGYLTHEIPIVVSRDSDYVVVEGNRRVAALKAIQNSFLAPAHKARIDRLIADVDRDSLRRISVTVAPDQDQADQVIAVLHTGNQRERWKPARQAAFFQAQIDNGKTLRQLLEQYPTIDVKSFVARSRVLELFRKAKYSDPSLKDFVNNRKQFPVSTLERLSDFDQFLDLAGIRVDVDRGTAKVVGDARVFNAIAEHVVREIQGKRQNTRTLNSTTSPTYQRFMDELRGIAEGILDGLAPTTGNATNETPGRARRTGQNNGESSNGSSGSPSQGDDSGGARKPGDANGGGSASNEASQGSTPPKDRRYLEMAAITVNDDYPTAIKRIFEELSTINIERFPNASLDLIRTFLEKTIKAYAKRNNESIAKSSHDKGFIQLNDCLKWLEEFLKQQGGSHRAFIQVVNKIRGGKMKDYIVSADHMNAINHNYEIFASANDVRDTWAVMKGMMELMLK